MDITVLLNYDFTPEWNNNKREVKPVVFHMRRLTTAERDKFMVLKFDEGRASVNPDRQGMFMNAVRSIDELKLNGEQIKAPRDLLSQPGLDALFTEVVADIIGQNDREDLKNS